MQLIAELAWRLMIRTSNRHVLRGVEIRVAGTSADASLTIEHLDAAFALIDRYAPEHMTALGHLFQCILVTDSSGGECLASVRACRLGRRYIKEASPLSVAMMIIHELRHAQLDQAGWVYRGNARAVMEKDCVQAEIDFAMRVPDSDEAIERARRLLASEWWDLRRHGPAMVEELRRRGVPRWIAKWLVKRASAGHESDQGLV